ncbi:MAG TPA: hypothetical protein VNT81_04975 [Vicinamibacterales bacterium]|nr:hypothetical protein [Vicinamibacterales bacterium]
MVIRALLMLLACPSLCSAQPAVEWLSPLVGVWNTTDTYQPLQGAPIVENAVRTCRPVMRNAYLECETVVERPNGTGRTYRFLINYNRTTSRFEMLSIWSNVPHKAVQSLSPNATRDRWILENIAVIGDNEDPGTHWSELVVESSDRIVWTGRRVKAGTDPRTSPISFNEIWTRRAP